MVITLLGGKYDGKYLNRKPLPVGTTIVIVDTGYHEVYRMRADGCAVVEDPFVQMGGEWARPSECQ